MEVNVPHVYKYKHPKTKKWYIGSHDGHNPNYDGSGVVWQHAKKKYGIKFFNKEIFVEIVGHESFKRPDNSVFEICGLHLIKLIR